MRSISWKTYLAAFVISAFLFGFGILAGTYLTQSVNDGLELQLESLKGRSGEVELLLSMNASQALLCPSLEAQLSEFDRQTTAFGAKLDLLENTRGRTDATVLRLKKEYMVQQARDFLLVQKINGYCGTSIPTILFFYTNQDCPECTRQGLVGPVLKQKRPDVMIYAFDVDLKAPIVDALQKVNAVNTYPSLVVNGQTLPGYRSADAIEQKLEG
ncbi:hypothetical protein HYV43_05535 [Candidatus Micrarchaeota archaeon]|nr:hypothetical protein [Candidatus Micrarchaeota archaeon]